MSNLPKSPSRGDPLSFTTKVAPPLRFEEYSSNVHVPHSSSISNTPRRGRKSSDVRLGGLRFFSGELSEDDHDRSIRRAGGDWSRFRFVLEERLAVLKFASNLAREYPDRRVGGGGGTGSRGGGGGGDSCGGSCVEWEEGSQRPTINVLAKRPIKHPTKRFTMFFFDDRLLFFLRSIQRRRAGVIVLTHIHT